MRDIMKFAWFSSPTIHYITIAWNEQMRKTLAINSSIYVIDSNGFVTLKGSWADYRAERESLHLIARMEPLK